MMNKHPYIGWTNDDPTPRHIIGGSLTGWQYTDANRQVKCPKCGSDPGYLCETPKGEKCATPHWQRTKELNDEFLLMKQELKNERTH
jgi:hypothetical protein